MEILKIMPISHLMETW